MDRAELLERYRELPLPTTSDEPWRFTDLKGFDPDRYRSEGHVQGLTPDVSMLDIDVAGVAVVTEAGIEIERAPEGVTFEPLLDDHPRLHELVGWDEKFAAHNAALWQHGLLVVIPRGVVARAAALRAHHEHHRRRRCSSACSSSPRRARRRR